MSLNPNSRILTRNRINVNAVLSLSLLPVIAEVLMCLWKRNMHLLLLDDYFSGNYEVIIILITLTKTHR